MHRTVCVCMRAYTNLKIDDDSERENRGHEVHEIGQVLTIERLAQCTDLVVTCRE